MDVLRDECLAREISRNEKEAQAIEENWRQEYNNRLHSSLNYLSPAEFARHHCKKNGARQEKKTEESAGTLSF